MTCMILFKIIIIVIGFLAAAYALFYKFVFLRDNNNNIPEGDCLVSPASGTVIKLETIDSSSEIKIKKGLFGGIDTEVKTSEPYILVSIFMSPLDVHINKMPIDGTIVSVIPSAGKFFSSQ